MKLQEAMGSYVIEVLPDETIGAAATARLPIAVGLQSVDFDDGANAAAAITAGGPG